MSDDWDIQDWENEDRFGEDRYLENAKFVLEEFFSKNLGDIFYQFQLQIRFEKDFYHWITYKALNDLLARGIIKKRQVFRAKKQFIVFFYSTDTSLTNTEIKKRIRRKIELINRSSIDQVNDAVGDHGELVTELFFLRRGYECVGRNTNSYQGTIWTKSNEDFDFIFEGEGVKLAVEVKNRFPYLNQKVYLPKIEIAKYLGLTPLFVVRKVPKNYFYDIYQRGGFVLEMWTKIFPRGYEALVKELYNEFKLPVSCRNDIPKGVQRNYQRLYDKYLSS